MRALLLERSQNDEGPSGRRGYESQAASILRAKRDQMSRRKLAVGALCSIVLIIGVVWLHRNLAYQRVETLTERYRAELQPTVDAISNIDVKDPFLRNVWKLEYFKILSFYPPDASVFAVVKTETISVTNDEVVYRGRLGQMYHLRLTGQGWELVRDAGTHPVWDAYGSMDGNTWPPYR